MSCDVGKAPEGLENEPPVVRIIMKIMKKRGLLKKNSYMLSICQRIECNKTSCRENQEERNQVEDPERVTMLRWENYIKVFTKLKG